MDIESAYIEDGIKFQRARMNRQGKVYWKLLKDLVTHTSIRRVSNRKKSQTIRDSKREIKRTCDGISASRERGLQKFQSRPTPLPLYQFDAPPRYLISESQKQGYRSVSFAIEYDLILTRTYVGGAPTDAELLEVYANYRSAVVEHAQQQVSRQSQAFQCSNNRLIHIEFAFRWLWDCFVPTTTKSSVTCLAITSSAAVITTVIYALEAGSIIELNKKEILYRLGSGVARLPCIPFSPSANVRRLTQPALAVVALLNSILFFAFPHQNLYTTSALIMPKLYGNTIYMVLNSRIRIIGGRDTYTSSADMSIPTTILRNTSSPPPEDAGGTEAAAPSQQDRSISNRAHCHGR
ncbi:hypothetical protein EV421DRAFT_1904961 [Armillaria borealis]|uniref:Uncharacterized protein n=1 Tax=Armillaria borealis TaxID=47425 RepID=A0AA39MPI6_9AGAR|nr:hypothetical protein EV421DRAFT_1904961 [Armillaria borealis]